MLNPKDLKDYILYERRVTIKEAAHQMGLSRVHLTNICNGVVRRGAKAKSKIKKWTERVVEN